MRQDSLSQSSTDWSQVTIFGLSRRNPKNAPSIARTVHYFGKVSGSRSWPGGIAYAGDLSVYPDRH